MPIKSTVHIPEIRWCSLFRLPTVIPSSTFTNNDSGLIDLLSIWGRDFTTIDLPVCMQQCQHTPFLNPLSHIGSRHSTPGHRFGGLAIPAIYFPQLQIVDVHILQRPHVHRPMVREEIGIGRLPPDTGAADRAEGVGDFLFAEGVGRHAVLTLVPGDVGVQGVDHQVAVDVADGAVAGCDRAFLEGRGDLDCVAVELDG